MIGLALVEGGIVFGSLTFISTASLQEAGVGAALAGSAAAGFGFANVAAAPVLMRVIPRVRSPLLVLGGGLAIAAGLLLVAVHLSVGTALLATAILGAAFGAIPLEQLQVWATQVYPPARALTISFFAAALFTGGSLASAGAAPLAADGDFSANLGITSAAAAVLAVVGALSAAASSRRPAGRSSAAGGQHQQRRRAAGRARGRGRCAHRSAPR